MGGELSKYVPCYFYVQSVSKVVSGRISLGEETSRGDSSSVGHFAMFSTKTQFVFCRNCTFVSDQVVIGYSAVHLVLSASRVCFVGWRFWDFWINFFIDKEFGLLMQVHFVGYFLKES